MIHLVFSNIFLKSSYLKACFNIGPQNLNKTETEVLNSETGGGEFKSVYLWNPLPLHLQKVYYNTIL